MHIDSTLLINLLKSLNATVQGNFPTTAQLMNETEQRDQEEKNWLVRFKDEREPRWRYKGLITMMRRNWQGGHSKQKSRRVKPEARAMQCVWLTALNGKV